MARKLGYLVPEFPGQTHAFFWRELRAIEEMGHPVRIYSTRRPGSGACPHAFADEAISRTRYLFPPSLGAIAELSTKPRRLWKALAYVRELSGIGLRDRAKVLALLPSASELARDARRNGVDHVHIHSCADAAHLGALAFILGDLPFSLTLHGDLSVYGTNHDLKMRHATFASAVTRPLAEQIRTISPLTDAPVIMMGVDCDRFAPADPARPANEVFTVATVARLNHNKGHRFFLRAMAQLRDQGIILHYRIAGDGPEKPRILQEIADLGLQDQTELLGSIDEGRVLDLVQGSDALALTSIRQGEAAPVTVMEGMACGLPVICSRIGGTADMVNDGVDGFLVDQEDVTAIADRLALLIRDRDAAAAMGLAARRTALRLFDHRENARKLVNRIFRQ